MGKASHAGRSRPFALSSRTGGAACWRLPRRRRCRREGAASAAAWLLPRQARRGAKPAAVALLRRLGRRPRRASSRGAAGRGDQEGRGWQGRGKAGGDWIGAAKVDRNCRARSVVAWARWWRRREGAPGCPVSHGCSAASSNSQFCQKVTHMATNQSAKQFFLLICKKECLSKLSATAAINGGAWAG